MPKHLAKADYLPPDIWQLTTSSDMLLTMNRDNPQRVIPVVSIILASVSFVFGVAVHGQLPEVQSPSYQVSGQVGWLMRYGLGDSRGLLQKGYSRGLFFSQTLALDADISVQVERPITGILELIAHLDNQQPEFLQSLNMRWQAGNWGVEFGDFPMGRPESPFASASRLLKGFKANWQLSERLTLSGIFSQVSGILQSRTFRGRTVEETITFAFRQLERPLLEEPYLRNLKGLEHLPLGQDYVEGFTQVKLAFQTEPRLKRILQDYELDHLFETIQEDPEQELDPSYYDVVFTNEGYFLILKREFLSLLRERLQEYIDDYNASQNLSGEERKEYPLSEGTDYELLFLKRLSEQVKLKVDSRSFSFKDLARQRFYSLGRQEIQEDSIRLELKIAGEFKEITEPELAEYRYKVYADVGILELDFPQEFFSNPESAVRVTYSYESGPGAYVLGLSVLKGSEKVYLNGQLLQQGVDYLIEYETGFLILLREVGSEDVLRVEYELARGALGVGGDYSQSFQGLQLRGEPWPGLKLNIDLLQSYDSPRPGVPKETLTTMPNTHTVLGVSGSWEGEAFQADFDLGFNVNRFPPDDNLRANLPNRINVIYTLDYSGQELILFGHRNGVLVYDGAVWSEYGIAEGLGGLTVYDIAADLGSGLLVFATSGGVSLLELEGADPWASFAIRANWKSFTQQDGLPSSTVNAVLIEDDILWMATDKGLAKAPLDGLSKKENWQVYQKDKHPKMLSDELLQLAFSQGLLYIGTDKGLMVFDPQKEEFRLIEELRGTEIHDLVADGPTVYVATDYGVRALQGEQGIGWLVADAKVNAIAVQKGELWYSTPRGLYGLYSGLVSKTKDRALTALGSSEQAIWAGEEATSQYELLLFEINPISAGVRVHLQAETRLDGRARDRYRDIPAEEHTDYGWISRLTLQKRLGPLELQGSLEGISPRFTPIGILDRQDHLRLSLGAVYQLSEAISLKARHEEGLSEVFRSPSQIIADTIGISFHPNAGPQIDLDYTIRNMDEDLQASGFNRRERSYTLSASQRFLEDRLNLKLGYQLGQTEDLQNPLYSFLQSELKGEANFRALPTLALQLGYRQPIQWRFGQPFGDRRLSWGANWSTAFVLEGFPVSLDMSYSGKTHLPLQGKTSTLNQDASVLLRGSALQVLEATLLPQLSLSLSSVDPFSPNANMQLSGEGTVQVRWADLEGRLLYKKSLFSHMRTQLDRIQDSLRFNLEYQGLQNLRPSLEFFGSLGTLFHPLLGRKAMGQYEVSLRLPWQPSGPLQMDLLLSHRAEDGDRRRTVSFSLQQGLQYALAPGLAPRLDFTAEYLHGQERGEPIEELSGELSLAADFPLMEEWGATVSAAYLFKLDAIQPRGSYHSFAVTFQVGHAFSLF